MDELRKLKNELWVKFKLASWTVKSIIIITALVVLPIGILIGTFKGIWLILKKIFKK